MAETFSNGGIAVVGVGGIDNVATTLPTLYRSGLPTSGTFRIRVEAEIMKVTTGGQSTSSWTVVRGQEGTTAASHAEGVPISQPFTAAAISESLAAAVGFANPMTTTGDLIVGGSAGAATRVGIGSNTQVLTMVSGSPAWAAASGGSGGGTTEGGFSSLPAAASGNSGQLYFPLDGSSVLRSTGSAWHTFGRICNYTPPVEANYSWLNQGTAVTDLTTSTNETTLEDTNPSEDVLRVRVQTVATGGWTFDGCFVISPPAVAGQKFEGGIAVSDGTKFLTFGVRSDAGLHKLCVGRWDNATTRTGAYSVTELVVALPSPVFLRIDYGNPTQAHYEYSTDGRYWVTIFSENPSSFLATSALNKFGYYYNYHDLNSVSAKPDPAVHILHMKFS